MNNVFIVFFIICISSWTIWRPHNFIIREESCLADNDFPFVCVFMWNWTCIFGFISEILRRFGKIIWKRQFILFIKLPFSQWVGIGGFSKVVAIFNHVGGPLIYLWPPLGCLNNPIFSNLGLCGACWACFMCLHKLWPTSVSHPFSSLGFAGGKHCQQIAIFIFRLAPQNFAIWGCFPYILFYRYLFPYLFLVGLLSQSVALFQSRELVKYLESL